MPVKPAIIPCLRYSDAQGAISFLCDAFGFERHAVYADDKDPSIVHHAQLVRDGCMIMVSSIQEGRGSSRKRRKALCAQGRPDECRRSRRQHPGALSGDRRRRRPCRSRQGRRRRHLHGAGRPGLWRPRLVRARPRGLGVEFRQLRSLGGDFGVDRGIRHSSDMMGRAVPRTALSGAPSWNPNSCPTAEKAGRFQLSLE